MYDFRPVQLMQTFFRALRQRFPLDFRFPFRLGVRDASSAFRFQTGFAFLITRGGSVVLFLLFDFADAFVKSGNICRNTGED